MTSQLDLGFIQVAPRGVTWRRHPWGVYFAHHQMLRDGEPTGTWVRHCGHPTALRPYYVVLPTGEVLERKFRLLADAKQAGITAMRGDA
jgi:hypothetical protein